MSDGSRILHRKIKCCSKCPLREGVANGMDDLNIRCELSDKFMTNEEERSKFPKWCKLEKTKE